MKAYELREFGGIVGFHRTERSPASPGAGEVRVRVRACSLNFRDLLIARGLYNPNLPLPLVPLSDGAGEVVEVGSGVTRFRLGDRVAGIFMQKWIAGELTAEKARSALGGDLPGMLSEEVVLPEEGMVPIPGHLSFEEGATLPCAGVTAWHALVEFGLRPGDTVLLLGTGGVSVFALQFARLAGAQAIVTSSSDEKLERGRQMGAAATINYRSEPDWEKRVRQITEGRGVDLVVEVGGSGTLPRSLQAAKHGGRIALVGVLSGAGEAGILPIIMKALRVQGIFVGSRQMFERMNRAVEASAIRPVIDRIFPFEEFPEALRHMERGGHFGKVVITI